MEVLYNVVINGQSAGPFPKETLVQMARAGQISPDSLVWREGLTDWCPIRTLAELNEVSSNFRIQAAPPPQPYAGAYGVPGNTPPVKPSAPSAKKSSSIAGLLCALLGAVCLLGIQILPFKIKSSTFPTSEVINHDLKLYPFWFGGLIAGCAFVLIGTIITIHAISDNHSDTVAIVSLVICILSLILAVFSLTKLQTKAKEYRDLKTIKDEYSGLFDRNEIERQKRSITKHNYDINTVTAEIDKILGL
ncbi:MAG: DUF4339 domain-containing protein [Clostridiales bacterium]|nr:DUF4339 domain-containing protein [Clostridiales bacterium]